MAMNIGLTGLDASQAQLDVTANNVANASSIGFKKSRAEFADIYSSGIYQKINVTIGQGTNNVDVAQQFIQGSTKRTKSVLDLSIQGTGFFATASEPKTRDLKFTRAGAFKLNDENYIVNAHGDYMMTYPVDKYGNTVSLSMMTTESVQVPTTIGKPEKSENLNLSLNLPVIDDASQAKDISRFDPKDVDTYNFSTASVIYDSVGSQHTLKAYYLKPGIESKLWNTDLQKLDSSFGTVMVDCSQVHAPGDTLDNTIAWAVFYEFDGKPIQPMNESKTDVEGFSYKAENLQYKTDEDDYPDLVTANKNGTGAAVYTLIDNTKIGSGRLFPGKEASDPPEGITIASGPPPTVVPDNHATAITNDHLNIINGDKSNVARPKDFWRCQFLFMGRGAEFSKPTNPVHLQPAGFVDRVAGGDETARIGYGTTLHYEAFTAPRKGEVVEVKHPFSFGNTGLGGGTSIETFSFDIDDTIQNLEDLAQRVKQEFDVFMQQTSTIDPTMRNTEFFGSVGASVSVDPLTAEIKIEVDETSNTSGTHIYQSVGTEILLKDVGEITVPNPVVKTFDVNLINSLQETDIIYGNPTSGKILEQAWVGLRIGDVILNAGAAVAELASLESELTAVSDPTISDVGAYPYRFLNTTPLIANPSSLNQTEDFLRNWVDALNECLDNMYHPQTTFENLTGAPPSPPAVLNDPPANYELMSEFLEFKLGANGSSIELHSTDPFFDINGTEVEFQLYPSEAAGFELPTAIIPPAAATTTNSPPTGLHQFALNSLSLEMKHEGRTIYQVTNGLSNTDYANLDSLDALPGVSIGDANITPGPHSALNPLSFSDPVPLEAAIDTGARCTLDIVDEASPGNQARVFLSPGEKDPRSVSKSGTRANLFGLGVTSIDFADFEILTTGGPNLDLASPMDTLGLGVTYPAQTAVAQPQDQLIDSVTHPSILAAGNFVESAMDIGANALYGIADQDQVVDVKYGKNTMYDAPFQVVELDVDGNTVGRLTTLDIDSTGLISAAFTNGTREFLGRVALARFNNEQGLLKVGNTAWEESLSSGSAIPGEGKSGTFGNITAASLEQSNVELSSELVDLIIGQRNYQANARSIEVDGVIQQTILQIR